MSRSDIIGCQSKESCEQLEYFFKEHAFNITEFNEMIHLWMPGVKTILPPDYFNDLNAACLVIPTTASGKFLLYINETYENEGRLFNVVVNHPDFEYKGEFASTHICYAIIMASINARVVSFNI
jgi:hypothetical protein